MKGGAPSRLDVEIRQVKSGAFDRAFITRSVMPTLPIARLLLPLGRSWRRRRCGSVGAVAGAWRVARLLLTSFFLLASPGNRVHVIAAKSIASITASALNC